MKTQKTIWMDGEDNRMLDLLSNFRPNSDKIYQNEADGYGQKMKQIRNDSMEGQDSRTMDLLSSLIVCRDAATSSSSSSDRLKSYNHSLVSENEFEDGALIHCSKKMKMDEQGSSSSRTLDLLSNLAGSVRCNHNPNLSEINDIAERENSRSSELNRMQETHKAKRRSKTPKRFPAESSGSPSTRPVAIPLTPSYEYINRQKEAAARSPQTVPGDESLSQSAGSGMESSEEGNRESDGNPTDVLQKQSPPTSSDGAQPSTCPRRLVPVFQKRLSNIDVSEREHRLMLPREAQGCFGAERTPDLSGRRSVPIHLYDEETGKKWSFVHGVWQNGACVIKGKRWGHFVKDKGLKAHDLIVISLEEDTKKLWVRHERRPEPAGGGL